MKEQEYIPDWWVRNTEVIMELKGNAVFISKEPI